MKYGIQFNASGLITATFSGVALDPLFSEISEADYLDIAPGSTFMNGVVSGPVQSAAQILEQSKTNQTATLRTACVSAITGGFTSSALGSAYSYPSDQLSQANMNTIAGSPSGGSLWCETGGVWTMKPHTQAQAQAVLASFVAWLNACQSKLLSLTEQVNNATTVEAVKAIVF